MPGIPAILSQGFMFYISGKNYSELHCWCFFVFVYLSVGVLIVGVKTSPLPGDGKVPNDKKRALSIAILQYVCCQNT